MHVPQEESAKRSPQTTPRSHTATWCQAHFIFCSVVKARGIGAVSLHAAGGGLEFFVLPSGEISSDATAEFILVFKKLEF